MKKTKKLIAMLLTLMMLLSILPVAAFADQSFTFADAYFNPATGDDNPSSANLLAYYHAYILVGGNDGDAFTTEVSESSKDSIAQDAVSSFTLSAASYFDYGQYFLSPSDASTQYISVSENETAYLVVYYTTDSASELHVLGPDSEFLSNEEGLYYDTEGTCSDGYDSGWIDLNATEPEPAHTHVAGTSHDADAATCTTAGNVAYSDCNDANCAYKLVDGVWGTAENTVVPATGHTYGDATYAWSGDSCTATRTCSVCEDGTDGHSISETKQGSYVKDTDATCTAAETGHYEVTFEDAQFGSAQTDADSVSNGEPNGHSFNNYVYNEDASCIKAGTKTAKCDNCEETDTVADPDHPQLQHSYTGAVKDNGDGTHSFKCVNGCGEYGGAVPCVDENVDGKCDICGAEEPKGFDFSSLLEGIFELISFKKTTDNIKTFSILTIIIEFLKNIIETIFG